MKKVIKALSLLICICIILSACNKIPSERNTEATPENDIQINPQDLLPSPDTVFFEPSKYKKTRFAVRDDSCGLILHFPTEWSITALSDKEYLLSRDGNNIGLMTSNEPDTSEWLVLEEAAQSVSGISIERALERKGEDFRYRFTYTFESENATQCFTLTAIYEEISDFTMMKLFSPERDDFYTDPGFSKLEGANEYKSILILGNSFIGTSQIGDILNGMLKSNARKCNVTAISKGHALVSTYTSDRTIIPRIRNGEFDAVFLCGLYDSDQLDEVHKMKAYCNYSDTELILFPAHNESRIFISRAQKTYDLEIIDWKGELDKLIQSGIDISYLCIDDTYQHSTPLAGYVGAHMIYRAMYGDVPTTMRRLNNGLDTDVARGILGNYVDTAKILYSSLADVYFFEK